MKPHLASEALAEREDFNSHGGQPHSAKDTGACPAFMDFAVFYIAFLHLALYIIPGLHIDEVVSPRRCCLW